MTDAPQLATYRWSSSDEADRIPVEDPATGEVIAVVQGGGPDQLDAAVEAAHRAFRRTGAGARGPSARPCCSGART